MATTSRQDACRRERAAPFRALPRWPTALACAGMGWLALPALAWALGEPTRIDVGDDGKAVTVPGEPAPKAGAKLPLPTVRRTAADKPVAAPKADTKPADAGPAAEKPPPMAKPAVELLIGYSYLPDRILRAISTVANPGKAQRDKHPLLQATTIDAAYRIALAPQTWIAVRAGVIVPGVGDQNWYASNGTPAPLYTQVGVVGIELMADYVRRFELTDWLGWHVRGGLGLQIVAGSVTQTETLPNCPQAKAATCPRWQFVGQSEVALPPVLPSVRATTGFDISLSKDASLLLEGGLRAAPYFGAGVLYAF